MKGIKYLLSDLDGVIRHFSSERDQEIERRCGFSQGILLGTAFEKDRLTRAITGKITDEVWRSEITTALTKLYSSELAAQAVADWSAFPGKVDFHYLDYLKKKFVGVPVAVLTNGTSRLHQDLKTLGIQDGFFKIFNSAEIGFCKPERRVFDHVVEVLGCKPSEIFFIDDSLSHVNTAKEVGLITHHYRSLEEFKKSLEQGVGQEKLEVAYHEAGHAVMALVYGLTIKKMSLIGTAEYRGVTSLEPFERQDTIEHADREIRLNLSGFVGQGIFSGNSIKIDPPHHPELIDSIGIVRDLLSDEGFRTRASQIPDLYPQTLTMIKEPAIRIYLNYILDSCFAKMIPLKPAIQLIAEELYKKDELSGSEVVALYHSSMQVNGEHL